MGFLNLDDDDEEEEPKRPDVIGSGLINRDRKTNAPRKVLEQELVEQASLEQGFARTTGGDGPQTGRGHRMGRPRLNESMEYWRIYISPDLRARLTDMRQMEGRRLNDLLADMLISYENEKSR
jgi:hypothetical protein